METMAYEEEIADATGIVLHEEEVVDLLARARAEQCLPDAGFEDPAAREIVASLEIDPERYGTDRLRPALALTILVDAVVVGFFERHPDGLAIGVNQGLCTRFTRLDNGSLRWIDVDLPTVAAFKRSLMRPCERRKVGACCSMSCRGWLECLREAADVPTIIVAQGSLRRVGHEDLDAFLVHAGKCAGPGTELVLDYDARTPLRPSSLKQGAASLESPSPEGHVARYPRLRFVSTDEYKPAVAHAVSGMNGVSRLFRGRGVGSLAHLRFT
jgi:O-methyltransferase involved in polyketide biosynthesis